MKFAAAVALLLALASVASARPMTLRSLLDDEDPIYCTDPDHAEDECPEHYECQALEKQFCKPGKDCVKDKYGRETCGQVCYEYACVEVPMYCEVDYDDEDDCVDEYGKDFVCKKLTKPECVYDKECEYVDTKICLEYKQEQRCEKDRQICKAYKQEKKCKPAKCTKYDKYNKCTAYGDEDCEYEDTNICKTYETVKGKCEYVNTTCKEYKQEEVCKDVEVCWTGKCVKVEKKRYSAGR